MSYFCETLYYSVIVGEITLSASPTLDFETTSQWLITVKAEDTGSLSATATLTIAIVDVNEAPSLINLPTLSPIDVNEDVTVSTVIYTVIATDPDNDVLTFSMSSSPSDGRIVINAASE